MERAFSSTPFSSRYSYILIACLSGVTHRSAVKAVPLQEVRVLRKARHLGSKVRHGTVPRVITRGQMNFFPPQIRGVSPEKMVFERSLVLAATAVRPRSLLASLVGELQGPALGGRKVLTNSGCIWFHGFGRYILRLCALFVLVIAFVKQPLDLILLDSSSQMQLPCDFVGFCRGPFNFAPAWPQHEYYEARSFSQFRPIQQPAGRCCICREGVRGVAFF